MKIVETGFEDLFLIEPTVYADPRGFFYESFNESVLFQHGLKYKFVQDNHSKSTYGVLRGLHFQKDLYAQTKLVRVISGAVIDVAVDLRKGSPTYLRNYTIELSAENFRQLLIPKGFAHGFVVVSPTAEFLYKCDNYYNRASEGGIIYNDPQLSINWGVEDKDVLLSDKDSKNASLADSVFDYPFEEFTGEKLYAGGN